LFVLVFSEVTVAYLLIAPRIALFPCTTKCSPKRIIFPGALDIEVK
jgi:hypothetical protein